jgi:hypothetical protein
MRQEIYNRIKERLTEEGIAAHVELWNRNIEFIEQETNWPMPAVFVEFDPIDWRPTTKERSNGLTLLRCTATLKLHVVTSWNGDETEPLSYGGRIRAAIEGMEGDLFCHLKLLQTHTNHDHEEIVESVEVYSYDGLMG